MHDLDRLYKTKLALLAVLLTVIGLAILIAARWIQATPNLFWLASWPLTDIGSALFTTGLVVVAFEYVEGKDSEQRASQRLRLILKSEASAIRDAVIDGFAFKSDDLARVATPEVLDQIIRNSLALRLGDSVFAGEIYDDIRDQAIRASERWHDVKVSVRLSTGDSPAQSEQATPTFIATVRWDYTVVPEHHTRRFACVSDRQAYRELAQEPAATSAWYMRPKAGIDASSQEAFELVQFSVDGEDRPIRRAVRKDGQVYSVDLGHDALAAGPPVSVSYTYRTLCSRHGHLLHVDVEQPTRRFRVELDYSDTDISYVNLLDFIASSKSTRVSQTSTLVPGKSIGVDFDGWVMPRSGVAFVWVLKNEERAK